SLEMSGTWTRRRRGTTSTTRREDRPLPPTTPSNPQQQVVRSLDKVFEEAQETGVLCLSSRKLKEYPEGISTKFDLTDLVAIDVSDNRLVEIPLCVCEYSSLETLDARENQLRRTPASIALLHALTYIDLSCNQLRDLPPSLFDLPIRIALLGGNQLESLPRITRATANSLAHLDISYNKFRILPSDLSLLSALRILNVSHNKLETIPGELCTLSLHTLDISSNLLSSLPLQLSNMRCIRRLIVVPNPLVAPPLSVVEKGREHIFKWLSVQTNQEEGWRFSASGGVATLRSFNSNSLLISSGWRDRRSGGGLTRGTTVTESTVTAEEKKENTDEGFASATTSKASPSSISNDSSTCASASSCSNCVSSSTASDVSTDFNGLLKVYDKKMASVVEKSEKENEESIGMKIEMEKKERVERAHVKRNESVRAPAHHTTRVPAATTVSHPKSTVSPRPAAPAPPPPSTVPSSTAPSSAPPPPPPHDSPSSSSPSTIKQRPVSKVAPMQSSLLTRSVVEKRELKGTEKKTSSLSPSPANGVKARSAATASANGGINGVAKSPSVARRPVAAPSSSSSSSTRPSGPIRVVPSRAANPSITTSTVNTTTRRITPAPSFRPTLSSSSAAAAARPTSGNNNSSTPSSSASSRSNSVTTTINNNTLSGTKTSSTTTSLVRKPSAALNGKSAPSAAPSDTVVVDRMKKTIDQRCGSSLDSLPIASLSSRLADGVLLCQLAHSFHPAVCTSISLPDKNTPLPSIKCKRNVESFLDACKELRVKPLVSCEDILGRRNLPSLARMVAALSKTTADLPVSHL
ncbi:hypothetical protein PMAYCL1PPCAC_02858, partial [Pristionchus mayeri]